VALVVGPLADTSRAGANPVRDESQHGSRLGLSPKSTFPKYVPGRDRELVKTRGPGQERQARDALDVGQKMATDVKLPTIRVGAT
jgi:hypothetical protein